MRTLLTDRRGNPIPIADRRSGGLRHKTALFSYVESRSWNDVVRRAKAHSSEVWIIDEQGNTPLHLACKFDPPVTVIASLGAAVSALNANGLTPLHVAASHRCNAKTLKALIDLRPASLRTHSRRDRTPMHYACLSFRGLDFLGFETLLQASLQNEKEHCAGGSSDKIGDDEDYDETLNDGVDNNTKNGVVLTWKDSTGSTPLGLLFRRYRERVKSAIYRLNQEGQQEDNILLQNDLGQLWGKARLIVTKLTEERLHREGSLLNSDEDDSSLAWAVEHHLLGECKFRIVHASVGLVGYGCPPELIRLAIAMHPQQVREMDEEGNLPLHIAATALSSASSAIENHSSGGGADDDSSVFSLTSFFSSATTNATPHAFDKVIQILLRNYPDAIRIPHGKSGRLPLVMAIRAGQRTWEDGIRSLVTAYPAALHSAKLQHAYPECLALIGGGGYPPQRVPAKEGGLRIFQNLYLLALHNRSNEAGRRGGMRRPRKHRSLNSTGCSKSKGSKSGRAVFPPTPRMLTSIYELLRTNPDMIDPQKYKEL